MADAYECDRCGDFDSGSPTGHIDTTLTGPLDLCESCSRDFHRWAKQKPDGLVKVPEDGVDYEQLERIRKEIQKYC